MYDPSIIRQHAADLYKQAERLVGAAAFTGAAAGVALGIALGFGLGTAAGGHDSLLYVCVAAVVAGALGAWIAFDSARSKAFMLRLEAQRALVLVQIEENTRSLRPTQSYAAPPSQGYGAAPQGYSATPVGQGYGAPPAGYGPRG